MAIACHADTRLRVRPSDRSRGRRTDPSREPGDRDLRTRRSRWRRDRAATLSRRCRTLVHQRNVRRVFRDRDRPVRRGNRHGYRSGHVADRAPDARWRPCDGPGRCRDGADPRPERPAADEQAHRRCRGIGDAAGRRRRGRSRGRLRADEPAAPIPDPDPGARDARLCHRGTPRAQGASGEQGHRGPCRHARRRADVRRPDRLRGTARARWR